MLLQIPEFLGTPFLKTGSNFAPTITNAHLFSSERTSIATFRCVPQLACHSISVESIAGVFHNKVVVATATSLVLERGFSDPVFGLAAVYAGLIMYDAQGVRREVDTHAKELNKVLIRTTSYSALSRNDIKTNYFSVGSSSNIENVDHLFSEDQKPTNSSLLLKPDNTTRTSGSHIRSSENVEYSCSPLKESIGHTEIEVAAGALLGFFVSLAICPYV